MCPRADAQLNYSSKNHHFAFPGAVCIRSAVETNLTHVLHLMKNALEKRHFAFSFVRDLGM